MGKESERSLAEWQMGYWEENFIEESPERHDLKQVIKVNITSNGTNWHPSPPDGTLWEEQVSLLRYSGRRCITCVQFSSVQSLSRVRLFETPWIAARQASLFITISRSSLKDSCPSSPWCHPAISSSLVPFSYCPQSLPASESFPMSQLFAWGGQSTGVSASASFLPKKSQGWSPSEWTGWISLLSKGLSRVFSNTTVQKHQFFGAQPSSQSNSHIHTWPQEKP